MEAFGSVVPTSNHQGEAERRRWVTRRPNDQTKKVAQQNKKQEKEAVLLNPCYRSYKSVTKKRPWYGTERKDVVTAAAAGHEVPGGGGGVRGEESSVGTGRGVRWKACFSQHERLGVFEILRLDQRGGNTHKKNNKINEIKINQINQNQKSHLFFFTSVIPEKY